MQTPVPGEGGLWVTPKTVFASILKVYIYYKAAENRKSDRHHMRCNCRANSC
jgi:hypothetical protein